MGGAGGSGGVTGAAAFLDLVEVVFLEAVELFFAEEEEEPVFWIVPLICPFFCEKTGCNIKTNQKMSVRIMLNTPMTQQ